jgi:hypothetical protein
MDIAFSKFEVVMDKRFEVLEERFTERQVVVYCDGVMENTIIWRKYSMYLVPIILKQSLLEL